MLPKIFLNPNEMTEKYRALEVKVAVLEERIESKDREIALLKELMGGKENG